MGTLGGGGAERVVSNVLGKINDGGNETQIITLYSPKKAYEIDIRTKVIAMKCSNIPVVRRFISILQLRNKIKEYSTDDIIVSFLDQVNIQVALAVYGLKDCPTLVFAERNDPNHDPASMLFRQLRDVLYNRADMFVYQTNAQKEYFKNILDAHKKQTIIENPIKENLPVYIGEKSDYFIAAGRLVSQKNYYMMIDAFCKVVNSGYDYRLKIYGNGPLKEELVTYIRDLNMENIITIRDFSSDIHMYMSKAKGYLLSSDFEGISNSMLEALAIGVPVVSTNYPSGGASMYINNGKTGHLVECCDTESFSDAIKDIVDDNKKALDMAEQAKEKIKELTPEKIAQKWISFLIQSCD